MSWRTGDETSPSNFLQVLHEIVSEGEEEDGMEDCDDGVNEEDSDSETEHLERLRFPQHLSQTRPRPRARGGGEPCYGSSSPVERSRSRSPLRNERGVDAQSQLLPPNVLIHYVVDGNGERFREEDMNYDPNFTLNKTEVPHQDEFWEPDAHALYYSSVRDGDLDESNGDKRGRCGRVRGGVRGGRRGRAPRVRESRPPRRDGWEPGQPLEEIWLHDQDVPAEFRKMVMDIVRNKQARAQETRERFLRKGKRERDKGKESEDEESQDATDTTNPLLLEGEAYTFKWFPMDTFRGEEELFKPNRTGSVEPFSTPYEAFRSFWDDEILQFITNKTNMNASQISSPAFQRDWFPTNSHEVLCLFAFWMMLGIIRMPTITSCFSLDPLLRTEVFSRIFTQRRYRVLTRVLNFEDDTEQTASNDPLHCLRTILDHLNAKFKTNYIPSENISIGESVTLWKGKLNLKQYITSRATEYGIKSFELCESATGYLWSFIIYTGNQTNMNLVRNPLVQKSTAVVLKLIAPLLNKGYRLFMDNWFNSPYLARFLKRNGTDCVGPLRSNQAEVPDIVTSAPLKQGQLISRHSGDVCVLSWQDKERVTMMSTFHGSGTAWSTVPSKKLPRPLPFKPQVVLDYDKWMGGVNMKDHMLEPYLLERKKCAQWQMKLFKRLLNCSILNARILLESSTNRHHDDLSFRLHLVDFILTNHLSHTSRSSRQHNAVTRLQPFRILTHQHWLVRNPQREYDLVRNRHTRMPCAVCLREGRKNTKSAFRCEACNVPLCVEYCYKAYHTS